MRTRHRCAPLCVLLAAASGCADGPDYREPAPPAGAQAPLVSLDVSAETPANPPDAWWHLYSDPRLDELLTAAFAANTADTDRSPCARMAATRSGFFSGITGT